MQVVCSNCLTKNRIPDNRVNDNPTCGHCKKPLFSGHTVDLTDQTFPALVSTANDEPVLVDFWATWCGPCRSMAPQFKDAAAQNPEVLFGKVETDQNPQTAGRFSIRSIPTLILFKNGREVARQAGAMSAPQINAWLKQALPQT